MQYLKRRFPRDPSQRLEYPIYSHYNSGKWHTSKRTNERHPERTFVHHPISCVHFLWCYLSFFSDSGESYYTKTITFVQALSSFGSTIASATNLRSYSTHEWRCWISFAHGIHPVKQHNIYWAFLLVECYKGTFCCVPCVRILFC